MQYGLMHKLPAKSLHHLHQLTAPATMHHQTYQHPIVQQFTQLHTHAQPMAAACQEQGEVHQYPAQAPGHAQAPQALDQPAAANHGQQQMHVQQQQGHGQHYSAAQYPPAAVGAQQEPGKQPSGDAAQEESPEGSIELGDDWIEKVSPASCCGGLLFCAQCKWTCVTRPTSN